ncbi:MAG: dickkopf-related protein, partial [Myxococcaceae bacterium]
MSPLKTSTRWMSLLAVSVALLLVLSGCRENRLNALEACKGVPNVQPDNPAECTSNSDCGDHFACGTSRASKGLSCCLREDRKCTGEAQCCPGQSCPDASKRCFDQFIACADDAECGNAGDLFCEQWTDSYGTSGRCRYRPCGEGGSCPANQSCFNGECLSELPCGGACPAGEACVPSAARAGRCQAFACPASCAPGFIATFKDSREVWDTCKLPSVECQCAALPPLHSKDLGRYSAIAADTTKNEVLVSEYDGEFGDLVVARFDSAGKALDLSYVDGVPASGTAKYRTDGPRKGLTEPGEDVGRYSDIVIRGNNGFVSYYDVTKGDLKLATRAADGTWKSFRVDGARGDVGLFTSVALDSDGFVGIAYFQRGADATFDLASCPGGAPAGDKSLITALKFARAKTATPSQESDFTVLTLACQARPPPVCAGCNGLC